MVGRYGFVTGLEVEDLTATAIEYASAAEYFAAGEPADVDELIGCGDDEVFSVGLLVRNNDSVTKTAGDGVTGSDGPEDLLVIRFSPLEVECVGSNELAEDLRSVAGVKNYESHTVHYASVNLIYNLIRNVIVAEVSPPVENVGVGEDLVGESTFGIVEGCSANLESCFCEKTCDAHVNTVGVDLLYGFVVLFVIEFIPNCNFHVEPPFFDMS